jgi:hypothetical protein
VVRIRDLFTVGTAFFWLKMRHFVRSSGSHPGGRNEYYGLPLFKQMRAIITIEAEYHDRAD